MEIYAYHGPPRGPRVEVGDGDDAVQRILDAPLDDLNVWFVGTELAFAHEFEETRVRATGRVARFADVLRRSTSLAAVWVGADRAADAPVSVFPFEIFADLTLDKMHLDLGVHEDTGVFADLGDVFADKRLKVAHLSVRAASEFETGRTYAGYAALARAVASIPAGRVHALRLELPGASADEVRAVMAAARGAHVDRLVYMDTWTQEVVDDPGEDTAARVAAAAFRGLAGETRFTHLHVDIENRLAEYAGPLGDCLADNRGILALTLECAGEGFGALLETVVDALARRAERHRDAPDVVLALDVPRDALDDAAGALAQALGGDARIHGLHIHELYDIDMLKRLVGALRHNTRLRTFAVDRHPRILATEQRPLGTALAHLAADNTGLTEFRVVLPEGNFANAARDMCARNAQRPRADMSRPTRDPATEIAVAVFGGRAHALLSHIPGHNLPHSRATLALLDAATDAAAESLRHGLAMRPPPADVDARVLEDFVVPPPAARASAAPGFRVPAHLTEHAEHATAVRYLRFDDHRVMARFVPLVDAVVYVADEDEANTLWDYPPVWTAVEDFPDTPFVAVFPPGARIPAVPEAYQGGGRVAAVHDADVEAHVRDAVRPAEVSLRTMLFYREMLRTQSVIIPWVDARVAATRCRAWFDGDDEVTDESVAAVLGMLRNVAHAPGDWVVLDRTHFATAVRAWGNYTSFMAALPPGRRAELSRQRAPGRGERRVSVADAGAAFRAILYDRGADAGLLPMLSDAQVCDLLQHFGFLRRVPGSDDVLQLPAPE